jgi:hypothetical protein
MIHYRGRGSLPADGKLGHPRPLLYKIAIAQLRVWYRTSGGNPQLESCDVQVKGIGSRAQLEAQLREVIPPRCRLVRWELLD